MDIRIYHARAVREALAWDVAQATVALQRGEYYLAGEVRIEADTRERCLAGAWAASQTQDMPWAPGQRSTLPGDLCGLKGRLWLVGSLDSWRPLPLSATADAAAVDSFEAFHGQRPIMLDYVDSDATEWGAMWNTLASRYGGDPVCLDPASGEAWQYHGTWCDAGGLWHSFRHRAFPGLGERRCERIRASTLYRPRLAQRRPA